MDAPRPHIPQAAAHPVTAPEERSSDVDIEAAMEPGIEQRRVIGARNLDVPDVLIQIQVLVTGRREAGEDAVLAQIL